MQTLIKTLMAMTTISLILYSHGINILNLLIILPIIFILLAIPYALLTNLFTPTGSRRQYMRTGTEKDE